MESTTSLAPGAGHTCPGPKGAVPGGVRSTRSVWELSLDINRSKSGDVAMASWHRFGLLGPFLILL